MFLRFKKTWSVVLIIIVFMLLWMAAEQSYKQENQGKIYCIEAQRQADSCIEIYQPVCGFPSGQPFSNYCFACVNQTIEYYLEGECE